jgi:hypothetical protein
MSFSFANPDGSFLNERGQATVKYYVPTTGQTITLPSDARAAYINPAGTIATLTIKLPPAPVAGQEMNISFGAVVTTLTMQNSAGVAVAGAGAAGAIGVNQVYTYIGSPVNLWKRWE